MTMQCKRTLLCRAVLTEQADDILGALHNVLVDASLPVTGTRSNISLRTVVAIF